MFSRNGTSIPIRRKTLRLVSSQWTSYEGFEIFKSSDVNKARRGKAKAKTKVSTLKAKAKAKVSTPKAKAKAKDPTLKAKAKAKASTLKAKTKARSTQTYKSINQSIKICNLLLKILISFSDTSDQYDHSNANFHLIFLPHRLNYTSNRYFMFEEISIIMVIFCTKLTTLLIE